MEQETKLSGAARWMLASTLITNIGNGMHTLTVGWLLYKYTGSVAAFGSVLILEYVVSSIFTVLSGPTVDRGDPRAVTVTSDLVSGLFICIAAVMLTQGQAYFWVLASVVIISIVKPFYYSSIFAIGPNIASGATLVRYNAIRNSSLQVGQLLGMMLAGPLIQTFGASVAFASNGFSYLLAGLAVIAARVPPIERKQEEGVSSKLRMLLDDWQEMYTLLRSNPALICHIFLCAGDFLAVSFVNLTLAPMVDQRYGGNTYWLSAFDGAFAVGAAAAAFMTSRVVQAFEERSVAYVGLGGQALLFAALSITRNPYLTVLLMLAIGVMSAFSLAILLSSLQRRSRGPTKGRISSIRNLTTTLLAVTLIPIVTVAQGASLAQGMLTSGAICAVFSFSTFILSRQRFFGHDLLGRAENEVA